MITWSLKSSIALLTIGLVCGFCICLLLKSCDTDLATNNSEIINPEILVKQAASNEIAYKRVISGLQAKNQKLETDLKAVKGQLDLVKIQTRTKEAAIKKIIEPKGFPAEELLSKVKDSNVDSSLTPCDGLVKEVDGYIEKNKLKDSLYEITITTLDSIAAVKDSIIETRTEENKTTAALLNQSLDQQKILLHENKTLKRLFKRQKFKSKLLSLGVMILSGFGANYLLHH